MTRGTTMEANEVHLACPLCRQLDGHARSCLSNLPEKIAILKEQDVPLILVDQDEEGVDHLRQEFEVPPEALPVRMQVGGAPVTIIGWVQPGEGNISALLRDVATEVEKIEKKNADSDS